MVRKKGGRILTICWWTYVVTYLCRVNFSSAMEKLIAELTITPEALGIIGSSFFLFYAVGQLINGFVGDHLSPYGMVMTALLSTSMINFFVSCSSSFWIIWLLWSLNGFFQSMIWGPLMRILAQSYHQDDNVKVSAKMSTSMVAGFLVSWVVFGRLFLRCSWIFYFLIPSILALGMFLFWKIKFSGVQEHDSRSVNQPETSHRFRKAIVQDHLWVIAIVCFGMGMVKETLSLWGPLLMTNMMQMEMKDSLLYISIIPMANFIGILFSRFLMEKMCSIKRVLITMFGIAGICSLVLLIGYEELQGIAVLLMSAVSGMMFGSNAILLSYIPISFQSYHIVSSLVGGFDFMSYMGAAVSSVILGISISNHQYSRIFLVWFIISVAVIALVGIKFHKTLGKEECE